MQRLPVLFAMRTSPAVILVVVVVSLVVWFIIRVGVDAIAWFKEQIPQERGLEMSPRCVERG